jgi:hypothetical protein
MKKSTRANDVGKDHATLRAGAHKIGDALAGRTCDFGCGDRAGSCGCLLELLRTFSTRLREHFEDEESGWKSGNTPDGDSTSRRWIERLMREHEDFRERLASVCTELEGAADPASMPRAACAVAIRSLLDDLLRHELSEARLFQRTVFEELGGGLE